MVGLVKVNDNKVRFDCKKFVSKKLELIEIYNVLFH